MSGVQDEPRWPRGAPDDEHGHGQGGRWASALSAALGAAGGAAHSMMHGLMTHDQVRQYVGRTDYEVFGQAGGANGQVEFRQYADGTRLAYKTPWPHAAGERDNELEASIVGHAIGAPVPATARDPAGGWLMQYIDDVVGGDEGERNTAWERMMGWDTPGYHPIGSTPDRPVSPDVAMLGLLDTLIGNSDRHAANVRFPGEDRTIGVDHGAAFRALRYQGGAVGMLAHGGLSEAILGFTDRPVQHYYSRDALREARRKLVPLRSQLRPQVYQGVLATIDKLIEITPETGGHDLPGSTPVHARAGTGTGWADQVEHRLGIPGGLPIPDDIVHGADIQMDYRPGQWQAPRPEAQLEHAMRSVPPENWNPDFVQELLALYRSRTTYVNGHITIHVEPHVGHGPVGIDTRQLLAVVDHLMSVAPPRHGEIRITVADPGVQYPQMLAANDDGATLIGYGKMWLSRKLWMRGHWTGDRGWHTESSYDAHPLTAITAHEWGHLLSHGLSRQEEESMHEEHGGAALSGYAQTDPTGAESTAEAFMEWYLSRGNPDNPDVQWYADQMGWHWRGQ